jgi:hypothetical protein
MLEASNGKKAETKQKLSTLQNTKNYSVPCGKLTKLISQLRLRSEGRRATNSLH